MPGRRAHRRQLSAIHTRYHFAAQYCQDQDVLEVACGAGIGLPYLARIAHRVVGGDIDENNLGYARTACAGCDNVELLQLDAEQLPFEDDSFDTVIICEAIYYLPSAERFFAEARRVLRPSGHLVVVTVNCRWSGFNPSPYSTCYLSPTDLSRAMQAAGFDPQCKFGFRSEQRSALQKLVGRLKQVAVKLRLIPRTMRGKEWLKRMFYGKLSVIDSNLTAETAPLEPLCEWNEVRDSIGDFAVIYAVGELVVKTGATGPATAIAPSEKITSKT